MTDPTTARSGFIADQINVLSDPEGHLHWIRHGRQITILSTIGPVLPTGRTHGHAMILIIDHLFNHDGCEQVTGWTESRDYLPDELMFREWIDSQP